MPSAVHFRRWSGSGAPRWCHRRSTTKIASVIRRDDAWPYVTAVCVTALGLVAAWLLRDVDCPGVWSWLLAHRKEWTLVVQIVGTSVTGYGLAAAYARAANDQTVWQAFKTWTRRQWGKPETQTITGAGGIPLGEAFGNLTVGSALVTHNVDTSQDLQAQILRLADFANEKSREIARAEGKITELRTDLDHAKITTSKVERTVLTRLENEIQELRGELKRVQVLDLKPAIVGLAITALGLLLSIGA